MPQAATLSVSLALPLTAGAFPQPPWPPTPGIAITFEGTYSAPRIVFSGAATLTLSDFPSLIPTTGAQFLLVTVDPVDDTGLALTAPVTVVLTGTTHGSFALGSIVTAAEAEANPTVPAGLLALASPGTAGGPTGIEIVTTAPAVVRVQAGG